MVFTKLHWALATILTLFASIIFFLFSTSLDGGRWIMLGCSLLTGVYALFSLYKTVVFERFHYNVEDEEELYKTSCPYCGELLRGHELSCPKCRSSLYIQHVEEEYDL